MFTALLSFLFLHSISSYNIRIYTVGLNKSAEPSDMSMLIV